MPEASPPGRRPRRASIPPTSQLGRGVVVAERFRLSESARVTRWGWEAEASDLARSLGEAPFHRVKLRFLAHPPRPPQELLAVWGALAPDREAAALAGASGCVFAVAHLEGAGAGFETPPCGIPAIRPAHTLPLRRARKLARQLEAVHRLGLAGVVADAPDVLDDDHGFLPQHIGPAGGVEEDLRALWRALRRAGLATAPEPPPSAREILEHLASREATLREGPPALPDLPPFVGREELLDELAVGVESPSRGVEVVVLTGPTGVGLGRLLDAFDDRLAAQPRVTRFRFDAHARGRDAAVRWSGPDLRWSGAALAAPIVDELVKRVQRMRTGAQQRPLRTGAFAETLRELVRDGRRAVLTLEGVEDLQGALSSFLHGLTAGDPVPGLMVVVAYHGRPPAWLERAATEVIAVEPLGIGSLSALLERALPGAWEDRLGAASALHQESGGLPALAWALLGRWLHEGTLRRGPGGAWRLELRASVSRQEWLDPSAWASLPEACRDAMLSLALWRRPMSVEALGACHGVGTDTALLWAQAAEAAAVARRDASHAELRVPEPLAHAIADAASPEQRREAHARLARWAATPEAEVGAAKLAWHQEHATPPGASRPLAEAHLAAAEELARRWVTVRAVWHLRRAIARDHAAVVVGSAYRGMARVAVLEGDLERAAGHWRAAAQAHPDEAAEVALEAARTLRVHGRPDFGWRVAREALACLGLDFPEPGWRAWLSAAGDLLGWLLRFDPSVRPASQVTLAHLYVQLLLSPPTSFHRHVPGLILRALRATQGRLDGPTAVLHALLAYGRSPWSSLDSVRSAIDRVGWVAEIHDDPASQVQTRQLASLVELTWGDPRRGVRLAEDAVRLARAHGEHYAGALALFSMIRTQLERTPLATLRLWLADVETLLLRCDDFELRAAADALSLWIEAESGAADGSARWTTRAQALSGRLFEVRYGPVASNAHAWLARALLRLGDSARAHTHAELATELSGRGRFLAEPASEGWIALGRLAMSDPEGAPQLDRVVDALGARGLGSSRVRLERALLAAARSLARGEPEALPRAWSVVRSAADTDWPGVELAALELIDHHQPGHREARSRITELRERLGRVPANARGGSPRDAAPSTLPPIARAFVLGPWLDAFATRARLALPPGLELDLEPGPELWLRAREASLHLLMLTVVQSARDAIEGCGRLRLSASVGTLGARDEVDHAPAHHRWVSLRLVASGLRLARDWPGLEAAHGPLRALGGQLDRQVSGFDASLTLWLPAVDPPLQSGEERGDEARRGS